EHAQQRPDLLLALGLAGAVPGPDDLPERPGREHHRQRRPRRVRPEAPMSAEHLLEVRGLRTEFPTREGTVVAVDGVDFYVDADAARSVREAIGMLARVGIPEPDKRARSYPHEFSGGMRQRAMIAMGLTTAPSVLIADEPTTALDVTIQAQILELLKQVNAEF